VSASNTQAHTQLNIVTMQYVQYAIKMPSFPDKFMACIEVEKRNSNASLPF